jgi:hypothetical protein
MMIKPSDSETHQGRGSSSHKRHGSQGAASSNLQDLTLPKRDLSSDYGQGVGLTDILDKLDKSHASHLQTESNKRPSDQLLSTVAPKVSEIRSTQDLGDLTQRFRRDHQQIVKQGGGTEEVSQESPKKKTNAWMKKGPAVLDQMLKFS